MPNAYLYVPGLARQDLIGHGTFATKVENTFCTMSVATGQRVVESDPYMADVVTVLVAKGVEPLDCARPLRWIQVPGPDAGGAPVPKPFKVMGSPKDNLLAREAGEKATRIPLTVGFNLTPCSLPAYLAQPLPRPETPGDTLSRLRNDDTLYILGHSNPNGGSLTYKCCSALSQAHVMARYENDPGCHGWEHCEHWDVDPVVVASLLLDEGLPNAKLDIAVMACFSGGLENDEWQTVQSFAQRLAGALAGWRYTKIRVYGAKGMTSADTTAGELKVAPLVEPTLDGKLQVQAHSKVTMTDEGNEPFYRRFFRFFKPR